MSEQKDLNWFFSIELTNEQKHDIKTAMLALKETVPISRSRSPILHFGGNIFNSEQEFIKWFDTTADTHIIHILCDCLRDGWWRWGDHNESNFKGYKQILLTVFSPSEFKVLCKLLKQEER